MTASRPIRQNDLPDFSPFPGYRGKLVHSETMTVVHWTVDAGYEVPPHSHPHEQILNVMEGEFDLTLDDYPWRLCAGDILVIPGHVPHSGRAITDCRVIDIWHPPRDDYQVEEHHGETQP
jgi:quercetin dioxygenase-like cupin family protein